MAADLGLEFPIFVFTHCRDVAAAVSKAGGLGVLGVAGHSLDNLRMELEWIENEVGDKPFGVDLLLPTRFVGSDKGGLDASQLDARIPEPHRRFVDRILAQHDVPPLPEDMKLPREFSAGYEQQRDVIELVFDHPIRLIASALALGAQGVWTGSVWLTTEEAKTHPVVKQKFHRATSRDTVRSRSLTGKPARQLHSAWTDAWNDPDNPDPLPMPLQPRLVTEAQARVSRVAHKSAGAEQLINYFVGQVVGSLNEVKSVRSVIEELVSEYADTMERLDGWGESDTE